MLGGEGSRESRLHCLPDREVAVVMAAVDVTAKDECAHKGSPAHKREELRGMIEQQRGREREIDRIDRERERGRNKQNVKTHGY